MNSYLEKHRIQTGEYTAAYTILGEGYPVIFLHGFFGDGWTLKPIMENLQPNYRSIGLDLLGFGDSSKPKITYLIDRQIEFLHNFLIAKQIKNFYLVGYSYGAWVAAAYAISLSAQNQLGYGTREQVGVLEGMSLIAPTGIRDDSFVGRYNHLKPLLWDTKLVDVVLAAISPFFYIIAQDKYFNSIRQARTAIVQQPAAKSFMCDRLKPEDAVDTVENDIHLIEVPTLVIAGEKDRHIPLWHSQTYAEGIPQAKLAIVPGADHDLVQTHSQEVSDSIEQHLNSHASQAYSGEQKAC